MAMWGVTCDKGTASVQSVGVLTAAASSPRRGRIISINIGSPDTPADSAFLHVMQRCSTAGTGTAKTPNALDPGDTLACTIVVKDTVTVDPTTTSGAFVDEVPLNQRNSYRWMAKDGSGSRSRRRLRTGSCSVCRQQLRRSSRTASTSGRSKPCETRAASRSSPTPPVGPSPSGTRSRADIATASCACVRAPRPSSSAACVECA